MSYLECISDNQAEEAAVTSESSTLLAKEEDLMDLETESSQPANPMITTWSTYTQCSDKSRKTYVTSVTLPAIQKQKKVEPQLPKYLIAYHTSTMMFFSLYSCAEPSQRSCMTLIN